MEQRNSRESDAAQRAQEAAEQAGAYVRQHTPEEMIDDARANTEAVAEEARRKAQAAGERRAAQIDDVMTRTGRQIHELAQQVRERRPEGQLGEAATLAANTLDRGGRYLEAHDLAGVRADLERIVRRYPLQSVLVGAGLGLLLARRRK